MKVPSHTCSAKLTLSQLVHPANFQGSCLEAKDDSRKSSPLRLHTEAIKGGLQATMCPRSGSYGCSSLQEKKLEAGADEASEGRFVEMLTWTKTCQYRRNE